MVFLLIFIFLFLALFCMLGMFRLKMCMRPAVSIPEINFISSVGSCKNFISKTRMIYDSYTLAIPPIVIFLGKIGLLNLDKAMQAFRDMARSEALHRLCSRVEGSEFAINLEDNTSVSSSYIIAASASCELVHVEDESERPQCHKSDLELGLNVKPGSRLSFSIVMFLAIAISLTISVLLIWGIEAQVKKGWSDDYSDLVWKKASSELTENVIESSTLQNTIQSMVNDILTLESTDRALDVVIIEDDDVDIMNGFLSNKILVYSGALRNYLSYEALFFDIAVNVYDMLYGKASSRISDSAANTIIFEKTLNLPVCFGCSNYGMKKKKYDLAVQLKADNFALKHLLKKYKSGSGALEALLYDGVQNIMGEKDGASVVGYFSKFFTPDKNTTSRLAVIENSIRVSEMPLLPTKPLLDIYDNAGSGEKDNIEVVYNNAMRLLKAAVSYYEYILYRAIDILGQLRLEERPDKFASYVEEIKYSERLLDLYSLQLENMYYSLDKKMVDVITGSGTGTSYELLLHQWSQYKVIYSDVVKKTIGSSEDIFSCYEDIFTFLNARFGKYTVEDGTVRFSSTPVAEQYAQLERKLRIAVEKSGYLGE